MNDDNIENFLSELTQEKYTQLLEHCADKSKDDKIGLKKAAYEALLTYRDSSVEIIKIPTIVITKNLGICDKE